MSLSTGSGANKTIYKIGVAVPAYNEERLIGETLKGIPEYVDGIYVVDDCSKDRTSEVVKSFTDTRVVLIRHGKNKGVGGAITTAYKKALEDNVDIVVVMAGDNQMDPDKLMALLTPIMEGRADYTKGNRLINPKFRKGMSAWRAFGNYILTFLNKIASGYWHVDDPQNGYTAISRKALGLLNLDKIYQGYAFENDMLVKLNVHDAMVVSIPIPARYGNEKSKIKYPQFIARTSLFFLEAVLWRIWNKYIIKLHPIGILYLLSFCLMAAGLIAILFSNYLIVILGAILFTASVMLETIVDTRLYSKAFKVR